MEKTINLQNDFDEKWEKWLKEIEQLPKEITNISKVKTNYGYIRDFYFPSVENTLVYGRLFFHEKSQNKPLIVLYHGLGAVTHTEGYKKIANFWINEGYSVIGMDSRMQGGKTIDPTRYEHQEYGIVAFNILTLEKYYSKLLFQDALQLINIIDIIPEIKNKKIVVTGGSKGGELSLLVASNSKRVSLCLCDISSGCNLPSRIKGGHGSYERIRQLIYDYPHLEKIILNNLSYFDLVNMTHKINIPVLASVGSKDIVCPPIFFYDAYQRINASKELIVYEEYGHGDYDEKHMPKKYEFIKKHLNIEGELING